VDGAGWPPRERVVTVQVFLSYASQDRQAAETVHLALVAQGHDVFFDREDLPPGEAFDLRIRRGIESSDLLIFLLSPDAVDAGSYTLTELQLAARAWKHPTGRILPVVLRPVPFEQVPAYLKSVTFLQPQGNVAAEVADAVQQLERKRTRRRVAWAALGTAVAATVSAAGLLVWSNRSPPATLAGEDGAVAVLVPAGPFVMGDDEESPRREVYLDAFYIDQHEVSVGRFAGFLKATGNVRPPDEWDVVDVEVHGQLPVVGVDWNDANAYCQWVQRRLPTEAEWEKAARGADGRRYPWGDASPTFEHANHINTAPQTYDGGLEPAGSHPRGRSVYGVHDLSGNAAEWVSDWYSESFARSETRNPTGPESGTGRVIRGGGRFDPAHRVTATTRFHAAPDTRSSDVGFRCAMDAD
jgi:formylglycine-generating enzyme required for sulfatase activity